MIEFKQNSELLIKQLIELLAKNPDDIANLDKLAGLYKDQAKYAQAEPLYLRSLAISEKLLGSEHQSEHIYSGSLSLPMVILEKNLGKKHPTVADCLKNLADLYKAQCKYAQAEIFYQRYLAILEKNLGKKHPTVADCLNNLADLYQAQGKYAKAETLYQRSLAIREKGLGQERSYVAKGLNSLAVWYKTLEITPIPKEHSVLLPPVLLPFAILGRIVGISLKILVYLSDKVQLDKATIFNNQANLCQAQNNYAQAEPLYQRSLAIREQILGTEHPDVATVLKNLASLYYHQGNYAKAEPIYKRSLTILEQTLGNKHPDVIKIINNLASLYQAQGNYAQAEAVYKRSLVILEQVLGTEHPDVAKSLNDLASLYRDQGNYAQAEPIYKRSLVILEQVLGTEHPDVAKSLNDLASLYRAQGNYAQAEPLFLRAQAIFKKLSQDQYPTTGITPTHYWFERSVTAERNIADLKLQQEIIKSEEEKRKAIEAKNKELADINEQLIQEQQRNAKLVQRYSHTLSNTIFPKTLYDIAKRIKQNSAWRKDALLLQEAYHAEISIILENELLKIRYSATNPEVFRQSVRKDRLLVTHTQARSIEDVFNYALSRVIARFLNENYAKMQSVRTAVIERTDHTLDSLREDFEDALFLRDPAQTAQEWCNAKLRPIAFHTTSALWQDVRVQRAGLAEAVLYGHLAEIIFNAFKYADHSADWFLRITLGEQEANGIKYLTIDLENPVTTDSPQAMGDGCGLDAIAEDLRQLNGTTTPATTLVKETIGNVFKLRLNYQTDLLRLAPEQKRDLGGALLQAKKRKST